MSVADAAPSVLAVGSCVLVEAHSDEGGVFAAGGGVVIGFRDGVYAVRSKCGGLRSLVAAGRVRGVVAVVGFEVEVGTIVGVARAVHPDGVDVLLEGLVVRHSQVTCVEALSLPIAEAALHAVKTSAGAAVSALRVALRRLPASLVDALRAASAEEAGLAAYARSALGSAGDASSLELLKEGGGFLKEALQSTLQSTKTGAEGLRLLSSESKLSAAATAFSGDPATRAKLGELAEGLRKIALEDRLALELGSLLSISTTSSSSGVILLRDLVKRVSDCAMTFLSPAEALAIALSEEQDFEGGLQSILEDRSAAVLISLHAAMVPLLRLDVTVAAQLASEADCFKKHEASEVLTSMKQQPAASFLMEQMSALSDDRLAEMLKIGDSKGAVYLMERFVARLTLDGPEAVRSLDIDALLVDSRRRLELLHRTQDCALDFLLGHLPSLPIAPFEHSSDLVLFKVEGISLSKLNLTKEQLRLEFEAEESSGELHVEAWFRATKVSAVFEGLRWSVKQSTWPFLETSGTATAVVQDASLRLAAGLRRQRASNVAKAPVLAPVCSTFDISDLSLTLDDDTNSALVVGLIADLFKSRIKDYVSDQIAEFLKGSIGRLFAPMNDALLTAWPSVGSLVSPHLDVSRLPVTEEDQVELVFEEGGPLGLDLIFSEVVNVKRARPASQADLALKKALGDDASLNGAQISTIDGVDVETHKAAELLTTKKRPLSIVFSKLKEKKENETKLRGLCHARFSPHDRPLGIILRDHPTMPGVVQISGGAFGRRSEDGSALAAENNNLGVVQTTGMILLRVGRVGKFTSLLGGMLLGEQSSVATVGTLVKEAAERAMSRDETLELTLCDSPDFLARFDDEPPTDLLIGVKDGHLVVLGFESIRPPSLARVQEDDFLHAVNDRQVTRNTSHLELFAVETRPLTLTFARQQDEERCFFFDVAVEEDDDLGSLILAMGSLPPRVRRVEGHEGPAARQLWQGKNLAILQVDGRPVITNEQQQQQQQQQQLEGFKRQVAKARTILLRDLDALAELQRQQAKS